MTQEDQGCLGLVICFLIVAALAMVVVGQHIEETRTCIAGGYAEAIGFNSTKVCVGIRYDAYTIESLKSVRLRLGLERGK